MATFTNQVVSGRYVSSAVLKKIELGFVPDKFELFNLTNQSSVANPGVVKKAVWMRGMTNGQALIVSNTAGAATDQSSVISSGGFSPIDSSDQGLESAKTITAITNANPAVVTSAAHGYAVGDKVRLYGTTGMLQIGGMDFEITAVTTNTFTLALDASAGNGFAAAATGGFARRHKSSPLYIPDRLYVTKVTQAVNAVVSTSVAHNLQTGEFVRLNVPLKFGMYQMAYLQAKVTRIDAFSFSTDIDSSAFSAFAFPASAQIPFTFAEMVPVGSFALGPTLVVPPNPVNSMYVPGSEKNQGIMGMSIGATIVGANNDVVLWVASKSDLYYSY